MVSCHGYVSSADALGPDWWKDGPMSAYMIITYDVSDPEGFKAYNPGSLPAIFSTVAKHGGAIIGAGPTDAIEGSAEAVCVLISFPSADDAKGWANDDEYAPLKAIRYSTTSNTTEYIIPAIPGQG